MKNIYLSPQETAELLKINLKSLLALIVSGKLLLYYPHDMLASATIPITPQSAKFFFDNPEVAISGSTFFTDCQELGSCGFTSFIKEMTQEDLELVESLKNFIKARLPSEVPCKRYRTCQKTSSFEYEIEIFVDGVRDMDALPPLRLCDLIIKQEDVDAMLQSLTPKEKIDALTLQLRTDAKDYVFLAKKAGTTELDIITTLEKKFGIEGQELHDLIWPERSGSTPGAKRKRLADTRKRSIE